MQKALSVAAPSATLILFLGVAVSSRATVVILGAYGLLFLLVMPPVTAIAMKRREQALRIRKQPRLVRALRFSMFSYPVLILVIITLSIILPSRESGALSVHALTTFGLVQVTGLAGLLATGVVATGIALWHRRSTYRNCPHCISLIPREASRCKYCTAEVEREPEPARIVQQKGSRTQTGTVIGTPLRQYPPPRHPAVGRAKRDFGQLSVPRPKIGTSTRTRPLPSEIYAQRRERR